MKWFSIILICVALWRELFSFATAHNDPELSLDRKVAADDPLLFVAIDNVAVVGTVMAGYDGHRGWIYSLAVNPSRQRRGVGTQLARHAVQALRELGCPKVNLQILADNAEVVAFYETLGIQVEKRISMGKIL
jgi:hypothetical protein